MRTTSLPIGNADRPKADRRKRWVALASFTTLIALAACTDQVTTPGRRLTPASELLDRVPGTIVGNNGESFTVDTVANVLRHGNDGAAVRSIPHSQAVSLFRDIEHLGRLNAWATALRNNSSIKRAQQRTRNGGSRGRIWRFSVTKGSSHAGKASIIARGPMAASGVSTASSDGRSDTRVGKGPSLGVSAFYAAADADECTDIGLSIRDLTDTLDSLNGEYFQLLALYALWPLAQAAFDAQVLALKAEIAKTEVALDYQAIMFNVLRCDQPDPVPDYRDQLTGVSGDWFESDGWCHEEYWQVEVSYDGGNTWYVQDEWSVTVCGDEI